MEINFCTHNQGKIKEAKAILEPDVQVNIIEHEYEEIQSLDPEEIAQKSAKMLAEQFQKPIVVDDSGLFITALNDFPGTMSAYVHKCLGLPGLLKLLEGQVNREAHYKCIIGYCEPGKDPLSFVGQEKGSIASESKGEHGFGHDPIFIPEGHEQTYAEMEGAEKIKKFRKSALKELHQYLLNR